MPKRKSKDEIETKKYLGMPYNMVKRDLPWSEPYIEQHGGEVENKTHESFFGIFSYESFQLILDSRTKDNPCIKFYNCQTLIEIKDHDSLRILPKGTELIKVEFRQHLGLCLFKPDYFIGSSARILLELDFGLVKKTSILGGSYAMGYIYDRMVFTKSKWIIPLDVRDEHGMDSLIPKGHHTLIVKYPSLEMEVAGKTLKPTIKIRN